MTVSRRGFLLGATALAVAPVVAPALPAAPVVPPIDTEAVIRAMWARYAASSMVAQRVFQDLLIHGRAFYEIEAGKTMVMVRHVEIDDFYFDPDADSL